MNEELKAVHAWLVDPQSPKPAEACELIFDFAAEELLKSKAEGPIELPCERANLVALVGELAEGKAATRRHWRAVTKLLGKR